jgi:hypothetical protein
VADFEGTHHDEVTFGDELRIGTFAASVQTGVQLAFAQTEGVECGVVDTRCPPNVQ